MVITPLTPEAMRTTINAIVSRPRVTVPWGMEGRQRPASTKALKKMKTTLKDIPPLLRSPRFPHQNPLLNQKNTGDLILLKNRMKKRRRKKKKCFYPELSLNQNQNHPKRNATMFIT
ncbi:hypothetical protein X975_13586, partial [Stegodyphus mimosarum]